MAEDTYENGYNGAGWPQRYRWCVGGGHGTRRRLRGGKCYDCRRAAAEAAALLAGDTRSETAQEAETPTAG